MLLRWRVWYRGNETPSPYNKRTEHGGGEMALACCPVLQDKRNKPRVLLRRQPHFIETRFNCCALHDNQAHGAATPTEWNPRGFGQISLFQKRQGLTTAQCMHMHIQHYIKYIQLFEFYEYFRCEIYSSTRNTIHLITRTIFQFCCWPTQWN